jgi:hypothetical protein
MKRMIFKTAFLMVLLAGFVYAGCSDWTKTEDINFNSENINAKKPETPDPVDPNAPLDPNDPKWVALRAWKATPNLPQTYLWFDSWVGISPTGKSSLRGLPDSVTIVANWGGHPKYELTQDRKDDMTAVQTVKGTKVVVTLFSSNVGDDVWEGQQTLADGVTPNPRYNPEYNKTTFAGFSTQDKERVTRQYAKDIYKMCIEQGYDGYDRDNEPYGLDPNLPTYTGLAHIFFDELSYWFGPGSFDSARDRGGREQPERRLLLVMDGMQNMSLFPAQFVKYVDYFVMQSYACLDAESCKMLNNCIGLGQTAEGYNKTMVQPFLNGKAGDVPAEQLVHRIILTENFEGCQGSGGGVLTMSSLVYNLDGLNEQIGGFGIYRVNNDYNEVANEWTFLPQGITRMYNVYKQKNP